jgi:hypothetical protein
VQLRLRLRISVGWFGCVSAGLDWTRLASGCGCGYAVASACVVVVIREEADSKTKSVTEMNYDPLSRNVTWDM